MSVIAQPAAAAYGGLLSISAPIYRLMSQLGIRTAGMLCRM